MSSFKIGDIVKGQVTGITKYGVFVSLEDDYSGLIHISEVSDKYVKDLKEKFMIGDIINVKIIDVDDSKCHAKLSIKELQPKVKKGNNKLEEGGIGFEPLQNHLQEWVDSKLKELKK